MNEKKCLFCGCQIIEGNKFCVNCGKEVIDTVDNNKVTNNSKTGLLTIIRPKSFWGSAAKLKINIDGNDYIIKNNQTLEFDLKPRQYDISWKFWCRRRKNITINVVEGNTYIIKFINDYLWGGFKISKDSKLV